MNPLLTKPKKDSHSSQVIIDLSWPLLQGINVNGSTPTDWFMGELNILNLSSAGDLCDLIRQVGRGCFLYATDITRGYLQLPLEPGDWPVICFQF